MQRKTTIFFLLFSISFSFHSCVWDKLELEPNYNGYPDNVGSIIIDNCAVSGCHNEKSKAAAGNLSLVSWSSLFEGSGDNAAVIPYRTDQSFLMFFINTYSDLGVSLTPTMPFNAPPLSKSDVTTIRDWISNGAPNKDGEQYFPFDANRKKIYVTNQGCDLVSVFDAETKLIMKYVDIGSNSSVIESPHMIEVSPDGNYWYVCFYAGGTFQKFNASTDEFVSEVEIGTASWNTFAISSDSKKAFVVDWSASGTIAVVDLETMSLTTTYQGSGLLVWPHGSAINSAGNLLYITAQNGNFIYKIDVSDVLNPDIIEISLVTGQNPSTASSLDPHEIYLSPDGSKYFVLCQKSNEVRVMETATDDLLAIIPTGKYPQEMSFSTTTSYAFVACTEDDVTNSGKIGSVSIIDYQNYTHVKSVYTGFQPHGIAVDEAKQLVYVANRNASINGPAPHHTTECGGRNGYLTIIDISTLELLPDYKAELSVDPYYVSIRN